MEQDFKEYVLGLIHGTETNKEPKPATVRLVQDSSTLTKEEETEAVSICRKEMDVITEEAAQYISSIEDLSTYKVLQPFFQDLVDVFSQIEQILNDDIQVSKLSETGKLEYAQFQKNRNKFLRSLLENKEEK